MRSLHDAGVAPQGAAEGDQGAERPPGCGHKGGGDIGSATDSVGYWAGPSPSWVSVFFPIH